MNNALSLLIKSLVSGCLLVAGTVPLIAQDDPFNTDPFGGQQSTPPPQEVAPPQAGADVTIPVIDQDTKDPTLQAILSSNPQTPVELARAINLLLTIDRDDAAKTFLQQLAAMNLTDEQSYNLFKEVGSDVIFLITNRRGLEPEGAAFGKAVLDAADRFATAGERITRLTNTAIRDEDKFKRSQALTDLRILGDSGAAMLIEKLVDPEYEQYWPRIRQAVGLFGEFAEGPLLAGLESNSLKLRVESLHLIGNLKSTDAIDSLILPMLSSTSTDLQREVARRSINRLLGRVPDYTECASRLYRSSYNYLMDNVIIGSDAQQRIKWWRWDADSRAFVSSQMTAKTVARIRGFQRANALVELNPGNQDYRRLYWVARLETAKLTAGIGLPLPMLMLEQFTRTMNYQLAPEVLNMALELNRIPAAIAACELMGAFGRQEFLESRSGTSSALTRALSFGSVRLKNAACEAIFKIDPYESFMGSSDYLSSLIYLSRSSGFRTALVGHQNLETAQSIAALTGRSGYQATATTTSQQLFDLAKDDPDLQLLVISDKLTKPGFSELVQAIRSSSQTQQIPILLMVEPESTARAERLADRYDNILVSPMVLSDVVIARQINNLREAQDYQDASQSERVDFSVAALEYLAHYAASPQRYSFLDIAGHQDRLIGGLSSMAKAANTCKVLGQLGTADAQASLLATANNQTLPLSLRNVAAESFDTAVQRRGLMLSRQQILNQYDLYNASETQPLDSQQIMGSLLDSIEKPSNDDANE